VGIWPPLPKFSGYVEVVAHYIFHPSTIWVRPLFTELGPKNPHFAKKQTNICRLSGDIINEWSMLTHDNDTDQRRRLQLIRAADGRAPVLGTCYSCWRWIPALLAHWCWSEMLLRIRQRPVRYQCQRLVAGIAISPRVSTSLVGWKTTPFTAYNVQQSTDCDWSCSSRLSKRGRDEFACAQCL